MTFHTETLAPQTKSLIEEIKNISDINKFYLTGGTALALYLGHRESEDLDFFIHDDFNPLAIQEQLESLGNLESVTIAEGTLNLFIKGVKLQFLKYPYRLIEPPILWNYIFLSSLKDIACTKLITILMRGSKKDFIDLYEILQHTSLSRLLELLELKYKGVNYNVPAILKALVYFDDAEIQPLPKMHIPSDWETVKVFLRQEVKKIIF